jgi:quinol monooxygenase YgiN
VPEEHYLSQRRLLVHWRSNGHSSFQSPFQAREERRGDGRACRDHHSGARATEGVINFDIARVLLEPDSFIATAIYEDGAALERQESAPEIHRAMAMFSDSLAAPPERTIFDASVDPVLV